MGYGTVIASIYFTALLLTASYVYADSVNRLSLSSWNSLRTASNIEIQRLSSGLTVGSIVVTDNRTKLHLNLTNTGNLKVAKADFPNIDILLMYTDEVSGTRKSYWLYYNSIDPSKHRWVLNSTISPNPFPSAVNPLDWDPSETLAVVLLLANSCAMKANTSGYVSVVLPNAVSTGKAFTT